MKLSKKVLVLAGIAGVAALVGLAHAGALPAWFGDVFKLKWICGNMDLCRLKWDDLFKLNWGDLFKLRWGGFLVF